MESTYKFNTNLFENPFIKGMQYKRKDIHDAFGGQRQGGISTPQKYPFIFLFTGGTGNKYGYKDEQINDDIFFYTGEGQEGDM
jgi:5-methylcytosine-specific restriction protein A